MKIALAIILLGFGSMAFAASGPAVASWTATSTATAPGVNVVIKIESLLQDDCRATIMGIMVAIQGQPPENLVTWCVPTAAESTITINGVTQ